MGFFRLILIFAAIYYGLKFVGRVILPWFLKRQITKMQQQSGNFSGNYEQQRQPEGKVTVQKPDKKRDSNNKDGEYVDFEEVK